MKSDSLEIVVKGESFTLSWDDDSNRISNNENKSVKYKLYYKTHGSSSWQPLDEIESGTQLEYTVVSEKLDYGIYDLGVSSVNSDGKESSIHSSLDMSADPFCGWYINWIGTK